MRYLIVLPAIALLTACGGDLSANARAVRDMCVANEGEAQYCTCVATTLEGQMAPEAFASIARGGEDAEIDKLLDAIASADASCKG